VNFYTSVLRNFITDIKLVIGHRENKINWPKQNKIAHVDA